MSKKSHKEKESSKPILGSDRPVVEPSHDAYGYAAFARRIAQAVERNPNPEGWVMTIQGPWGSGKSTFLNFVKYELAALKGANRPIVIDFNPWWFEGQQNLAAQFLAQFSARLPKTSERLQALGDLIADYSDAVGTIVGAISQIPLLGEISKEATKKLARTNKDVPKLKGEIAKTLRESGQRFLFIIDDIDRLTPDEIRELFKVVKALADFPNVTYLLAFDAETVSTALEAAHGVDGHAYLEKIVQAPFSLPAIDHARLRTRFQQELQHLVDQHPEAQVDTDHWHNVYLEGLDPYLSKPRDIVRIMNALSVTYPGVVGEVNLDFVAMEFLRVFEAPVYSTVREHSDMFTGHSNESAGGRRDAGKEFHESWLGKVPDGRRKHVRDLMRRLFPRLQTIWGNMGYSAHHESRWRNELRVCSAEVVDVYFQFGVAHDVLSRFELNELLKAADEGFPHVVDFLSKAAQIIRPSGTTKARDYLDRIRDCDKELTPKIAISLATALSNIGDSLLSPADEQTGSMFGMPNRWRLLGVINHLMHHTPKEQRSDLVHRIIAGSKSVGLAVSAIETIEEAHAKPEKAQGWALNVSEDSSLDAIKQEVVERLQKLSDEELLTISELDFVISRWLRWSTTPGDVVRLRALFDSDALLPRVLEKYLRFGTRQVMNDRAVTRIPILDPKNLESIVDIAALEPRVKKMLARKDLTADQRTAGDQYLWGMDQIRQGKNSGSMNLDK